MEPQSITKYIKLGLIQLHLRERERELLCSTACWGLKHLESINNLQYSFHEVNQEFWSLMVSVKKEDEELSCKVHCPKHMK